MILLYLQFCGSNIQAAWLILLFGVISVEALMFQMAPRDWHIGKDGWKAGLTASLNQNTFAWPLTEGAQTAYSRLWDPGNSRRHTAFYDLASKVTQCRFWLNQSHTSLPRCNSPCLSMQTHVFKNLLTS